ncbi:MAG: heme o synthase [Actinomycetota bacterium]
MNRRFQKLSVVTTATTLLLVVVGAIVRVTKSGLGCGTDWPHCHGKLVPTIERATVAIEYSHRLLAATVGLLVLSLTIFAWLKMRQFRSVFWPALAALVIVVGQGWIGRNVVIFELRRLDVVVHFMTAMTLLGILTVLSVNSFMPRGGRSTSIFRHGLVGCFATVTVLVVGALVSQYEAAGVFRDWPLMNGGMLPRFSDSGEVLHFGHRVLTLVLGAILVSLVVKGIVKATDRLLVKLAKSALVIWALQVAIGALNVFTRSDGWAVVAHVGMAASLWVTVVWFTAASYRRSTQPSHESGPVGPVGTLRQTATAFFMLTKPRIVELLLITTVPAMLLAGKPSWWLVVATLVGGTLSAGSANSINCYFDRDIDVKMERTSGRPLPQHQVTPRAAGIFGVALGVAGFVWLALLVNLLAAALATSAIVFYVFIYTLWLKRTSPSNIVIGGAAGAVPVLVGWAAVTGKVEASAWVMFAIIFYWTPPHFWALALKYREDYERAGVPMLPVVKGVPETARQILLYSAVLVAVSLVMLPVAGLGWLYLTSALVLGGAFIGYAWRLKIQPDVKRGMALFHFSLAYLVLLFAAMALDRRMGLSAAPIVDRSAFISAVLLFAAAQAAILIRGNRRVVSS